MSEKHHIEKISGYNDKISIYNLVYKNSSLNGGFVLLFHH
jgi:hypothetical protein